MARTYVSNWNEHGLVKDTSVSLHLVVAYDLKYSTTKPSDYRNLDSKIYDLVDSIDFVGDSAVKNEVRQLVEEGVVAHARGGA